MVTRLLKASLLIILLAIADIGTLHADVKDPFDPFDSSAGIDDDAISDDSKTPEELMFEATVLMDDERLLDARTKLLKALQKDPKEFRAHLLLGGYYMVHVGHFRLALKYILQGQKLFFERYGKPPYVNTIERSQHARILYLLSQARLNLDDYEGSLAVLDEYTSYGYFDEWYPGTRAWVLMKLGRLQEAIRAARMGIMTDVEAGRTLNMLGILLSMTGERQSAIEVFRKAIALELALGKSGQPATPLNNVGEVYEEIFDEAQAQSSYQRATSMPDGCEHILPSLNLAKLYLDELNFELAKKTMDSFESCIAQYPLRNGEEHRALLGLARGRIALLTGYAGEAIKDFRDSLENRQWFGKIGTSEDDLKAAALISLAQSLRQENNILKFHRWPTLWDSVTAMQRRTENSIEAWWLLRRARQVLIEDLKDIEDLYIRNTDSMIEYPTFGEVLADIPTSVLEARIALESKKDQRPAAANYYALYLAESYVRHGRVSEGEKILAQVVEHARPRYDDALRQKALLLLLENKDEGSDEYRTIAGAIFALSRAALRNYGFRLPVKASVSSSEMTTELSRSAFLLEDSGKAEYSIAHTLREGQHVLTFTALPGIARARGISSMTVQDPDISEAVNKLTDQVFTQKL